MANTKLNFSEFLSNLPKEESFNRAFANLYLYEGAWIPAPYLEASLILQDKFQAQPSDIFLCSFPKTGTTWLKALAFAVITRDRFNETTTPLVSSVPHDCLPMLDEFIDDSFSLSRKHPLIATHDPYKLLPKSIIQSGSKIVYIFREPKDTFTSLWHMTDRMQNSTISSNKDSKAPLSMEELFGNFCAGKVAFGSYWDHVLGYWKASIKRPDKFLFLKYEDVKRDSVIYVKKLAEFMGKPFSIDEINDRVPQKIVKMCSFEKLSNLEVNKTGRVQKDLRFENKVFFRKGVIGDWKNHLTEDMRKKIDTITIQKLQNTGLTFL